jgi:hypothetical protein
MVGKASAVAGLGARLRGVVLAERVVGLRDGGRAMTANS